MKKIKLKLRRETLRALRAVEAEAAHGGVSGLHCIGCKETFNIESTCWPDPPER